jgi:peroxiredoxin
MLIKIVVLLMLLVGGVFLVSAITDSGSVKSTGGAVAVGSQAPDFALQDLQGRTWKLSELKGKVVLLHFWATWCTTCEQENPTLQRLVQAERENQQFVVLSVLVRDDADKAKAYMAQRGFDFPVLSDDRKVSAQYGLTGVPETFLIDKNGTIRDKVIGPNVWDSADVRAALARFAKN